MTAPAEFQRQAVLWGQSFEVAVKRGVIACLLDWKLIDDKHPALADWQGLRVSTIYHALELGMDAVDEESRARVLEAAKHLVSLGYGLGFTAMREYLRHHESALTRKRLEVRGLWCPLTLPGEAGDREARQEQARNSFHQLFHLSGSPDPALTAKGQPANADFLLWLSGDHKEDHLLVQEYSYDMPGEIGDFRTESAHLNALERHVRLIDGRGVFARVCAEVAQESFELSASLRSHLSALTTENKPFYKLCQGATYADSTLALLTKTGQIAKPCVVRALAITPNGFESLAARWSPNESDEPRLKLLRELGAAYRMASKCPDGDETWLTTEVSMVFNALLRRLPKGLQKAMRGLKETPKAGEDFELRFDEEVEGFTNPAATFKR
ncbi:MAG: helicase, partial [Casimicrobiaceae bacterium]